MGSKNLFYKTFITMHFARLGLYSEHRKMPPKPEHVCKEMNQYMINTNRKWILSFGIDIQYTILV